MTFKHIYHPVALNEYKEAINWYLEKSELAAQGFVDEVKQRLATICDDPFRYRNMYKKYWETSLKHYPYSIIYMVDEQNKIVIVSSIYHHKRNPKRKYTK